MTDYLTARITEIQRDHWQLGSDDEWVCALCGSDFHTYRTHREHLSELIAQADEDHYRPRIENMEQLDALSVGTIIRDDEKNIHERLECWDDEASGSVWATTEKMWGTVGIAAPVIPALPVTVLWSPGAGE